MSHFTSKSMHFLALVALGFAAPLTAAESNSPPPAGEQGAAAAESIEQGVTLTPVKVLVVSAPGTSQIPRYYTGALRACRTSDLGFKQMGRLGLVNVDEGDRIKAGQLLAWLDESSLRAQSAAAKAKLAATKAKLAELVAGPRAESLAATKAEYSSIEARREQAQSAFDRVNRLQGSEAISQQDVDNARLQLLALTKKLEAQKHVVAELEAGTRSEQLDQQRAAVDAAQALVDQLAVELKECRLCAPYDAIVSQRLADEGEMLAPGTPVLRIVEANKSEAWIGVPTDVADAIHIGDSHTVKVGAVMLPATVKAILPELDAATRTQTVILALEDSAPQNSPQQNSPQQNSQQQNSQQQNAEQPVKDSNHQLVFGRIVQLQMTQEAPQKGFWLPLTALTRGARGLWSAFTVVGDNPAKLQIKRSDVEVVQVDAGRILVRGTLQLGDRVVMDGVQKLTDGQLVTIAAEVTESPGERISSQ